MNPVWQWKAEIGARVGAPADFEPSAPELEMLNAHLPPVSDAHLAQLTASTEGQNTLIKYLVERHERLWRARSDPLRHGFELAHWRDFRHVVQNRIETFVPGGNNSAKSWLFGKLIVEVLTRRFTWPELPASGMRVLAIAQDDNSSKMFLQPAVYAHLPLQYRSYNQQREKKRQWDMKVNYSDAGGFTDGVFTLPSPLRSQCWFKTVAQYWDNPRTFEGPAYHLVTVDEGCPRALWSTLKIRARKVGGRLLYALTCVDGYDEVMGDALEGARVTRSLPMQWTWKQGRKAEAETFNAQHSTSNLEVQKA